jgi:hypothetical protein
MASVDITSLLRAAIQYQKDIKFLPYAVMAAVLGEHGINLFPGVQNEDRMITFLRKQGVAKPYHTAVTPSASDVGKVVESILKVETAYAYINDNIKNYKEKFVITPNEMLGSNKTKKHPLEMEIISAIVKTFSEDILDALFNATRNTADETPMGLFDGFETKVLAKIVSGEIAAEEGNYVDSGEFAAPVDANDVTAYNRLRDWVRQADPYLLKQADLILPLQVARYCMDALKNKTAQKAATFIDFQEYLREDTSSNIRLVKSRYMGTGDRLYLTASGNMDFGMNSLGDEAFVQVRNINVDPNIVNFWIQAEYGVRWRSVHKKTFFTNQGSLTANALSGDYS